jgi:hypothetical protein
MVRRGVRRSLFHSVHEDLCWNGGYASVLGANVVSVFDGYSNALDLQSVKSGWRMVRRGEDPSFSLSLMSTSVGIVGQNGGYANALGVGIV